jgi:2-dehydropantoate 2-reductase
MDESSARLLVFGAGVNGSAIAAGLHDAGQNVTVLARGTRYCELITKGIIIQNPINQRLRVTKVPAIEHLAADDAYDYILVVIRKNQIAEILPLLRSNSSANVVFMGNNLAGPEDFIRSLGKDRVMMGAVYAAGKRDGNVIRAIVTHHIAAPVGEIDGRITPRLMRLVSLLRQAGFAAKASTQIIDFQATHAAGVALIGKLTLNYNCDTRALARARDDLMLFVQARREAFQVLRAIGRNITPWSEAAISALPVFLQIAGMRALLNSRLGEVGLGWHVSQAADEMRQLEAELKMLVNRAGLFTPAIARVFGWAPMR